MFVFFRVNDTKINESLSQQKFQNETFRRLKAIYHRVESQENATHTR